MLFTPAIAKATVAGADHCAKAKNATQGSKPLIMLEDEWHKGSLHKQSIWSIYTSINFVAVFVCLLGEMQTVFGTLTCSHTQGYLPSFR